MDTASDSIIVKLQKQKEIIIIIIIIIITIIIKVLYSAPSTTATRSTLRFITYKMKL